MREIGQNLKEAKEQVKNLLNVNVLIKINEGRGKSSLVRGSVVSLFPAVFSVRLESGELKTYSYADVHTKNILFLAD